MKIEPVCIEATLTWYIGGNVVGHRRGAEIIIPIDQLNGIDDIAIGARVRSLIARARLVEAEDNATWIKNNWSRLPASVIEHHLTAIQPFAQHSDHIRHICAALRVHLDHGHAPKPQESLPRSRDAATPGWIYIICGETGHYKIGRARTLPQRISDIMLSLPFRADLYHAIPTDNMRWAERTLHERFAAKRTRGEWFRLNNRDLDWLVSLDRLDAAGQS